MYRCNYCREVFDEFAKHYDKVGNSTDSLPPAYLEYDVCPHCGEDDWESVSWCKNCEDDYADDVYCVSCMVAASYHLNACITGIVNDTMGSREEVIEMLKELLKEKE